MLARHSGLCCVKRDTRSVGRDALEVTPMQCRAHSVFANHAYKTFDARSSCFIFSRVTEFAFDLAVIGGGSAGYAAARTAASAGLKTVVIEGGKEVGGLCILRGCMPSKALLYAADVMHLASHAEPWGIRAEDVTFNFSQVMARKDVLIKG